MNDLKDILSYSDGKLFWKVKTSIRTNVGDRVGYVDREGYRRMSLRGSPAMEHRVIWEFHNGPIPEGMQIDHINHIRSDNRIENLRLVTAKENGRNKKLNALNTSGCTGVQFNKEINKWLARIVVDGKVKTIGYYETFDEAKEARMARQFKENFHQNHGLGQ